jgi:PIN domain nuclease of toxin-antitoxin system
MRLLVDTHVAVWAVNRPSRLPLNIRAMLEDGDNDVFVSLLSIWEIAIKYPLQRHDAPPISAKAAIFEFEQAGFALLPILLAHVTAVETLPLLHGDPFDRLLVAQASSEPMRLVTHDSRLREYGDFVMTF